MSHSKQTGVLVVADTTPINYLVQLEAIDLLQLLFGRVLVPRAVFEELAHHKSRGIVRSWIQALPPWVEVVDDVRVDATLGNGLGAGERDAISLAVQMNADLLLIDELAGRKAALERKLSVAGTLAILLQGSVKRASDFPSSLKKLRSLGFRMSDELELAMLERYEAIRNTQ